MAFTEALRLVVDADTRGAVQGIEKLGTTADRELSRSEKRLDQWGNRLTSLGTGMVTFGAAALVGLGSMAKASEDANLAQVKLQNTIDNMPKLAGATTAEFTDLAESIQKVTAADADAIVEAQALLGTFNLTADEIKTITPLVVDYSRKFGVDMADAAVQVGKALDGNVGALKRNGVSIDETLFKTDRYRAVQEALSDQVGGFAEAEGKTFAGSLQRMKNELGDLAEGVGGGAVDAFTTLFGAVERGADALESISPGTQNLIGQVATFGSVGLIAAGGVSILVGQAIKARESFSILASGVSTAIERLGGLKNAAALAGGVTGLAGLAAALELYNQQQQQANVKRLTAEFLAAGESAAGMRDVIQSMVDKGPTELVAGFAQLAETNREAAERFIETAEAAGASGRVIEEMKSHLETMGAAQDQATKDTEEGAAAFDDAAGAAQSYGDTLKGLFDPLFAAIDAQDRLADANADVIAKEMELAVAIEEHGVNSIEAMTATDNLRRAQNDAAEAAVGQVGALDQLRRGLQDGSIDIDEARRRLDEFVTSGLISAETAAGFRAELDRLDGKTVNVEIITRHTSIVSGVVPGTRNIPLRQHGGPTEAGQIYQVAEAGPELYEEGGRTYLLPRGHGQVVPFTGSMGGGSGGGAQVIELHSHLFLDGRELVESVKRYERTNGTGWRN